MDTKTIAAVQNAFKVAMEAFNVSLMEALSEGNGDISPAVSSLVAEVKHRGRPRKADKIVKVVSLGGAKRRGRPPKADKVAKIAVPGAAPKHRGRHKKSV